MSDLNEIEPWLQTSSGGAIDILSPSPAQFRLTDIAISLSLIARFNGHTLIPWSVASHSLLCEAILPREVTPMCRLYTLMHDAHEMVTGDIVTPMKEALAQMAGADLIGRISRDVQLAIHAAAGMPPVNAQKTWTKAADLRALAMEKRDILVPSERPWKMYLPDVSKETIRIIPESIAISRRRFVQRFLHLADAAGIVPPRPFLAGVE